MGGDRAGPRLLIGALGGELGGKTPDSRGRGE